jgi:hypothetical protein
MAKFRPAVKIKVRPSLARWVVPETGPLLAPVTVMNEARLVMSDGETLWNRTRIKRVWGEQYDAPGTGDR